ncbi:HIR complex subunit [Chytridiales sp. JEL 0842]|nr:HIR complex subunit [Chytridiales sp. JEL 0842]
MYILLPDWIAHVGEKDRKLPIYSIHVQPIKNGRIATGGQDGKVKLWNQKPILDPDSESSQPKLLSTLALHSGAVLCVRWSNEGGRYIASGSDDNKIVIWEQDRSGVKHVSFGESVESGTESWKTVKVLIGHESDVVDLAWSPNNEYLASCGLDSFIFIWDGSSFDKLRRLDAHQGFVKGLTWDPAGKFLASQSDDKTVKIWRISDWFIESEIREPYEQAPSTTFFRRLSWSPEGSCIVTANGENGNIPVAPIISRHDWSTQISLVGHQAPIEVSIFNPITFEIETAGETPDSPPKKVSAAVCAIAGQDRGVSVWWTTRSYCAASTKDLFKHSVLDMSWAPDGYTLYACSYDGTVAALTFDSKEFGVPLSIEEKINAMAQYGYSRKKMAVVESTSQLLIEERQQQDESNLPAPQGPAAVDVAPPSVPITAAVDDAQKSAPKLPAFGSPPAAGSSMLQRESRTQDGKKRIQPVLIRGTDNVMTNGSRVTSGFSSQKDSGIPFASSKRPADASLESTPKRVTVEGESKPLQYVLPTCIVSTKKPQLLGVPKLEARLMSQIATGPLSDPSSTLNIEVTNQEKGGAGSKIVGVRSGAVSFTISLNSAVLVYTGGEKFIAFSCANSTLHIFSPSGRRLLPSIVTAAPVSHMSASSDFLLVITALGGLYVWNIPKAESLISNESVIPLLETLNETKKAPRILSTIVKPDGMPHITTTNGTYVFHNPMKTWMNVTGFDADARLGQGGTVRNESGFAVPVVTVTGKMNPSLLLPHIENGMASALVTKSAYDYKQWLLFYARKIADEGILAKAREICDELLGPIM